MAVGFAIATFVFTVATSEEQRKAGEGAAGDRRNMDKENIARYNREVGESVRRTELEQSKIESQARAGSASSGFAKGSSLDNYINTIQEEHKRDIDWMRTSGASQSAIFEKESEARQRAASKQTQANYVGGYGKAVGAAGNVSSSYNKYGWGY